MPPPFRSPSVFSTTTSCAKHLCKPPPSSRSFSTTPRQEQRTTRARRAFFKWLNSQGDNFRNPLENSTNYLGAYDKNGVLRRVLLAAMSEGDSEAALSADRKHKKKDGKPSIPPETEIDRVPFPLNRNFVSQRVLSEELREEIWRRIMKEGKTVREVSVEFHAEMSRVGAVVRLKEIEKEWKRIGKPLARPYANAVMSMLPKTEYSPSSRFDPAHESINDLPVHASTGQQIFYPTAESRHFTRVDAAKIFNEKLLPADDRIPHPEMVIQYRELKQGLSREEREQRAAKRAQAADFRRLLAEQKEARENAKIKRVDTGRWEFRFTEANVDDAGKTGRGYNGVGWRYGMPLYDRGKGQVKIPTSVE